MAGVLSDLDYKVAVASTECERWTDNTLQVVQYVVNSSTDESQGVPSEDQEKQMTMEQMLQQFPYLERLLEDSDCSQLSSLYYDRFVKLRQRPQKRQRRK